MTSLTLGGCDGSLYMYSRATISECVIPQWRDKTILPQEKLFMMGQNDPASGEVIYGGTKRSCLRRRA
jgi:hypothetical protein